jgi:hypothetical protein
VPFVESFGRNISCDQRVREKTTIFGYEPSNLFSLHGAELTTSLSFSTFIVIWSQIYPWSKGGKTFLLILFEDHF